MKICLNISGQIRLASGETLIDKIDHIKSAMHFDKIFMHLWLDDYLKYEDQLSKIENKSIIIVEPPILDEKFYYPNISKIFTQYPNREYRLICELYGMQCVFQQSCLEDFDIHIRARYDSHYLIPLNLSKYFDILDTCKPTVIIPLGGDIHMGLPNAFGIYNKSGAWKIKNIITDTYKISSYNVAPFISEPIIRSFLINYHNYDVYRISYPMIINQKYLFHDNFPTGNQILKDKMRYLNEWITDPPYKLCSEMLKLQPLCREIWDIVSKKNK